MFFFLRGGNTLASCTLPLRHSQNVETACFLPLAPPLLISLTFFPPSHFPAADRNQIVARVFLILAVCHQFRRQRRVNGCLDTEDGAAVGPINGRAVEMFTQASRLVHVKLSPRPHGANITPAAD